MQHRNCERLCAAHGRCGARDGDQDGDGGGWYGVPFIPLPCAALPAVRTRDLAAAAMMTMNVEARFDAGALRLAFPQQAGLPN